MVFGFGGDSDEDKKKKKQQEEEEDEEGRKTRPGRRRRPGRHGDKDDESDEEEDDKKTRPGGRRRPDRKGDDEDEDEEEEGGKPTRPGRHGRKDEDEDEAGAGRPGRPGRHGRKGDGDEDEKPTRPGRHGREDDADEAERPGRPGRHGRKDDEDEHAKPTRPGRHGRHDEDEEEPEKPAHARPGRPGRHGRHDDDEEEPEKPAHGRSDRPGRPGRHDGEGEEPEKPAHGRPDRPGRPGRHEVAEEDKPAHVRPGHPSRPGRHDAEEEESEEPAHVRPGRPSRPGHHEAEEEKPARPAHVRPDRPARHDDDGKPAHGESQQGGQDAGPGGVLNRVIVRSGQSIQAALDKAEPGMTIVISSGVYNEALKTKVDGTEENRIRIVGREGTILKGDNSSDSVLEINHDFYTISEFTICGEINGNCDKDDVKRSYREKCILIAGNRQHRSMTDKNGGHFLSSVNGILVKNMVLRNSGEEAVRLKYFATKCCIQNSQISSTGRYDFKFGGSEGNGEGIHIGTSNKQWKKNLTGEQDICRHNVVRENFINTHAGECVGVKEGAMDTRIESNYCTGQMDKDSGGIDSRASNTIIRYNKVEGCKGAGIRLGGNEVDGDQYGIACEVYGNELVNNDFAGIKIMTEPHQIFKNKISGRGGNYKAFRGNCAGNFEETDDNPLGRRMGSPPDVDIEASEWFKKLRI